MEEGLITFLRETFTAAIYHDHFSDFRAHLEHSVHSYLKSQSQLPSSSSASSVDTPYHQISGIVEKIYDSTNETIKKNIQHKLLLFLQEYHQQLHMYFIPNY